MKFFQRFDNFGAGFVSGLVFPFLIGIVVFIFTSGNESVSAFVRKLADSEIITHSITLCVFPNVFIFLIFNRFDMLKASRGILAMTIIWAIIVFGIKFFG